MSSKKYKRKFYSQTILQKNNLGWGEWISSWTQGISEEDKSFRKKLRNCFGNESRKPLIKIYGNPNSYKNNPEKSAPYFARIKIKEEIPQIEDFLSEQGFKEYN